MTFNISQIRSDSRSDSFDSVGPDSPKEGAKELKRSPLTSIQSVVARGMHFFNKKPKSPLASTDRYIEEITSRLQEQKKRDEESNLRVKKEAAEFDESLEKRQKSRFPANPSDLSIKEWVDNAVKKAQELESAKGSVQLPVIPAEARGYFPQKKISVPSFALSFTAKFLSFLSTPAQKVIDALMLLVHKNHSFLELGSETDRRLVQKLQEPHLQTDIKKNEMKEDLEKLNDELTEMKGFEKEIAENIDKVPFFLKLILQFVMKGIIENTSKESVSDIVSNANAAFLYLKGEKEQLDQQQETLTKRGSAQIPAFPAATSPAAPAVKAVPLSGVNTPVSVASTPPANDITSLSMQLVHSYTVLDPLMKRLQEPHLPNEERTLPELAKIHLAKEEIELTAALILAETHNLKPQYQIQILTFLLGVAFKEAPDYVQKSITELKDLEKKQQTLQVFIGLLINKIHFDFEVLKTKEETKIEDFSTKLQAAIEIQKILSGKR